MGKSYKRHRMDFDDSDISDYQKPSKDDIREKRKLKQQEHDKNLPDGGYNHVSDDE